MYEYIKKSNAGGDALSSMMRGHCKITHAMSKNKGLAVVLVKKREGN